MTNNDLFITCVPGLEELLQKELLQLGYPESKISFGGLSLPFVNFEQIYTLNFLLRTASRILLPIASFTCRDKEELYKEALQIDWGYFFRHNKTRPGSRGLPTFVIDAHVQHQAFNHSVFAAQVVKDAICDLLRKKTGERPTVDTKLPQLRLNLFIQKDRATIYFDTSGRPLHERGYRQEGGAAPLRETLAAALLQIAGYTNDAILVDPCAGSGTFVIEAALVASATPSQFLRSQFGFMNHPLYDQKLWQEVRQNWLQKRSPLAQGGFTAIEKNPKTFVILEKAIARAGFQGKILTICADFRKVSLPIQPNFVIANPPYGERLEEVTELSGLYKSLGDFMKASTKKPARGFVLSGNQELTKKIGLATTRKHIINNGGIDCRLLEYDLY